MLHKKRKPSTFTSSSGFADCKRNTSSNNNMLHSKSTYFYGWSSLVPSVCGIALFLGLGIILNPAINSTEEVHAETVTANPTGYSSISLTISHSNTDGSSTELNTGDTVSTNVEPGLISYISNNLKIDTKKINKFYISVQAAEDGTTELTGTNNHATIAPVGSNKIPTATDENGFGDNTWGFALGEVNADNANMSYNSLPAYGASTTPQYSSATNLADGTYNLKLTFAAKINADKPSDHYTTKAMVSVAADAKVITLLDLSKMEEMTTSICGNTKVGDTKQLTDDRDGAVKSYWVAKLKDDNCWMTQNLDLDLNAAAQENGITEALDITDLTTWNSASADKNVVSDSTAAYHDPGLYVYSNNDNPITANGCNLANISDCTSYGWVDVTGYTPYTTTNNNNKIVNTSTKQYDAHYALGNYYSWEAATNGTGSKATNASGENGMGAIASGSICPKGWKLPLAGASCANGSCTNDNTSGSFRKLLSSYGFTFGYSYNGTDAAGGLSQTGLTSTTGQHAVAAPLYFVRSGFLGYGKPTWAGDNIMYWSSVASSNTFAYYLSFWNFDYLAPSNHTVRSRGHSVRCVAE